MSFEIQVYLLICAQIIIQWILIGNDFLNYYLDHDYFNQLQQLERGERNNAN